MSKIRNGFVTNSSSSSFILGFTNEELMKNELLDVKNDPCYKALLQDCERSIKLSFEEALKIYEEELEDGWFSYWLLQDFMKKNGYKGNEECKAEASVEFKKELKESINLKIKEFTEKCKGKNIFISILYSDDCQIDGELQYLVHDINACMAGFWHH